jgi:hypothetical protein
MSDGTSPCNWQAPNKTELTFRQSFPPRGQTNLGSKWKNFPQYDSQNDRARRQIQNHPENNCTHQFTLQKQGYVQRIVTDGLTSLKVVISAVHQPYTGKTRRRPGDSGRGDSYQKNGLNAGYALRPSHFWMPQVG